MPQTISTEVDQEAVKSLVERRNIIMQNILDVKKMRLAYLMEREREEGIAAAKRKAKAVVKRKAAKAARKVNRRR